MPSLKLAMKNKKYFEKEWVSRVVPLKNETAPTRPIVHGNLVPPINLGPTSIKHATPAVALYSALLETSQVPSTYMRKILMLVSMISRISTKISHTVIFIFLVYIEKLETWWSVLIQDSQHTLKRKSNVLIQEYQPNKIQVLYLPKQKRHASTKTGWS